MEGLSFTLAGRRVDRQNPDRPGGGLSSWSAWKAPCVGLKVELYNTGGRNVRVFDPWYISLRFSYNGILRNSRLSTAVIAVFPKPYPSQR